MTGAGDELVALADRGALRQPAYPAMVRARVEQHANDVGMPLTSCDAERRVVVVEAPHDRRPLVGCKAIR